MAVPLPVEWVDWATWCQSNGLPRLERQNQTSGVVYRLETASGVLRITSGTRLAHWEDVGCWLGYAPKVSAGKVLVHALDLHKNLLPLIEQPAGRASVNRVIVIDPGHGGDNPGTQSIYDQRLEKDLTLDWALRLQPLLESNGWTVYLTRTNDCALSLAERVALADDKQADLFISLHFNSAFPKRDQAGVETYCLTPAGLPSTMTRNYEDDSTQVFPNNSYDAENLTYAVRLHRALIQATGSIDRGIRRARFMGILRPQNRPAVLLEAGYLSNPTEARHLSDPDYRQKLAGAIANALVDRPDQELTQRSQ